MKIRGDTSNKIKHGKTFLSFCHVALFQCPGNIADNVLMTSCRCLKQLSFAIELNFICESRVDIMSLSTGYCQNKDFRVDLHQMTMGNRVAIPPAGP